MSAILVLDKGLIELNTPGCVVEDICRSVGISVAPENLDLIAYRHSLSEALRRTPPLVLSTRPSERDLKRVKHWLNPVDSSAWLPKQISTVLGYTLSRDISGKCGYPTPADPARLSPAILYSEAVKRGFKGKPETTASDICKFFSDSLIPRQQLLRQRVSQMMRLTDRQLHLLEIPSGDYASLPVQQDELKQAARDISSVEWLQENALPTETHHAIALGALAFSRDLSYSKFPEAEYFNLASSLEIPLDERMRAIYGCDESAFNLDAFFNPLLPEQLYHKGNLASLSQRYDCSPEYDCLAYALRETRFLNGVSPRISNFETIIGSDDIRELEPSTVIVTRSSVEGDTPYTLEELARLFTDDGAMDCHPVGSLEIYNLRRLASSGSKGSVSRTAREQWSHLLGAISSYDEMRSVSAVLAEEALSEYLEFPEEKQRQAVECLRSCLELGLRMRGWSNGRYLLKEADCPRLSDEEVLPSVSMAIGRTYENRCPWALGLRLVRYIRDAFEINSDLTAGSSIEDRIGIVTKNTSDWACIRLSSNYICASCHLYLAKLTGEPPFEIGDLDYIM